MNKQNSIEQLVASGKKVFTTEDLAVMWGITNRRQLIERIKYYLRQNRLAHITKGVYAYGDYTPLEVAQKLVPMSYISLYTTSQMHGLSFQYYETIFCMALSSKTYTIGGQSYVYHKLKEPAFYNQLGLSQQGGYTLADKERTICDMLYVFPGSAFDNLDGIDTQKLTRLAGLYGNKRLAGDVAKLIQEIS